MSQLLNLWGGEKELINTMSAFHIPSILLAIPRNPVTAVGLPLVAGFLSSGPVTTKVANSNWYYGLSTPPGNPPREVFPIVWTLLYCGMGYASHVAVKALDTSVTSKSQNKLTLGIALYYAQLGLNLAWTPLFFGAHKVLDSLLVDSAALTLTTLKLFDRPTNGKATWFLLPYCGWLAYATYLNAGVWWLNGPAKKPKNL
ncbi:TspO/MBR family-domain-containing protein [Ephemerocybe angulata]|uniref:TspO/MBR family-domain-containing protein n=1 Tax=Ephemerocybe angulata TaxID=980116 RepID=A0A8H6MEN0_9AGAR|nr:TspO/MBR family-domain-containing protein [Tulosesus angulatus]